MDAKFYSVTKFINEIKTNKLYEEHQPQKVIVWFESDLAFTNKFKQQCIKPIALTLKGQSTITLTHKTLLDTFDNAQPIVSFTKTKLRCVPKTKKNELSYLAIDTEQKVFDGKAFYSCRTGTTSNVKVIKNIIDKKVNEDFDEDNNDLGDDLGNDFI